LAYIYINHKELEIQTPTALFASLCKQLLLNKPLPLMLQNLWQYHHTRQTPPTLDNMLRVLETVLCEYHKIYLIVDALDEYLNITDEQRGLFVQNLVKIVNQFPVHLMITTRPNNISQDRFPNSQQVPVEADITLYVENQFKTSDNLSRLLANESQLKDSIQTAMVKDVDGM
ncbi:hypothetical protein R3P38DRAFT_2573237, partial [Favolaschia claudopus]